MRKIHVNGNTSEVRTLSPFAYKDTIKSLDKSSESRVTLDGVRMPQSCVTGGRDVKSGNGGMKYHLYFYTNAEAAAKRDVSAREFLPITAEEYRAYKNDPGYIIELTTVTVPTELITAPAAEQPTAEAAQAATETAPTKQPSRKAHRVQLSELRSTRDNGQPLDTEE